MDGKIRMPVELAGEKFILVTEGSSFEGYFEKYRSGDTENAVEIAVSQQEAEELARFYPEGTVREEIELSELSMRVSDTLLDSGCCIFHGLAFLWKGRAWLFTAPSGTGKSTQYFLWKRIYGDELRVINGDKPFLSVRGDVPEIMPSPWMGKEKIGNDIRAELGGIILLRRDRENRIRRLSWAEAAAPLFRQFIFTADSVENIEKACRVEEKLLNSVPVFLLENKGDNESARLTHDRLLSFLEDGI